MQTLPQAERKNIQMVAERDFSFLLIFGKKERNILSAVMGEFDCLNE